MEKIISSEYPLNVFYDFWTKKESVIKADGRGLEIPLNEFEVINNSVCINSSTWHLQELIVNDNYKAHLATSHLITDHIVVQHVNVFMKASFEICSMLSNEKF